MGASRDGTEGQRGEASIEELVAGLSPEARALAARGVAAARAAEGPFGYLGGLVNMRALEQDDGDAALVMDVTPNVLNRYGYVHGGMLFTLADYAMGAAARTLIGEDQSTVTLEAKANYLTNVKEGQLVARCSALHQTERLIMLETRITASGSDDPIMVVTGTYYIIPKRPDKQE